MSTAVGLDLSLKGAGIGLLSDSGRMATARLSSNTAGMGVVDRHERLWQLRNQILRYVGSPVLVVVEQPAYGQTQGQQHDRSGLWWLVVSAVLMRDVPVVEVPPQCLKRYATSKGNAGKDEVLSAVVRKHPAVDLSSNDEADALVLARMGGAHLGWLPVEFSYQRAAMEAVAWPER
jgi:crossover junction endodeoxyribonuclease RuvC